MTLLIAGLILIALAAIGFIVVLQATRRGEVGGLFSDDWVANLHAPLMVGLLTFGTAYLVKFALLAIP